MIVERELLVKASIEDVYSFHLNPTNLMTIIPPELRARIIDEEGAADKGRSFRVRIWLMGQETDWVFRITRIGEGEIAEEMAQGPIKGWRHTHQFESLPQGTMIRDRIEYKLPFGHLGIIADRIFLRALIERILDYRALEMRKIFGGPDSSAPKVRDNPLTISLWKGNLLQVTGIGLALLILSFIDNAQNIMMNLVPMTISWLLLWYSPHGLAHYSAGRILGIDFRNYFIGISNIIRLDIPLIRRIAPIIITLGIRTEKESMERTQASRRAWMFRSGAIASMLCPFTVPLYATTILGIGVETIILSILSIANLLFTLYFSTKVGDLAKARKTMRRQDKESASD